MPHLFLSVHSSDTWVGYYLATNQTSPPPGLVPVGPYFTMLATAPTSRGPWVQNSSQGPVFTTGSPGPVIKNPSDPTEYWQLCTGCAGAAIGIVATRDLLGPWAPVMGLIFDPVENVSLFFDEATGLWWIFTNHIGPDSGGMAFDDSIWAFWSSNLTSWPPAQKAVVLNRTNVVEPSFQTGRVGLPALISVPGNTRQLSMVYDGGGTRDDVSYNENCSVALAWLDLPLVPPTVGE